MGLPSGIPRNLTGADCQAALSSARLQRLVFNINASARWRADVTPTYSTRVSSQASGRTVTTLFEHHEACEVTHFCYWAKSHKNLIPHYHNNCFQHHHGCKVTHLCNSEKSHKNLAPGVWPSESNRTCKRGRSGFGFAALISTQRCWRKAANCESDKISWPR